MEKSPFLLQNNRIESIDALRGFAVLGVVVTIVERFAMISATAINPIAQGDLVGINKSLWKAMQLFSDQKFIPLLALVFGVGIFLFSENLQNSSLRSAKVFYKRMLVLMAFGLLHAYLLWYGGFLFAFAICGVLAFWFRGLSSWVLIALGFIIYFVPAFNFWLFGKSMEFWPPEVLLALDNIWQPDQAVINEELAAMRGGVIDQLGWRISAAFKMQTVMFAIKSGWQIFAMMMVGMGLYKLGMWRQRASTLLLISIASIFLAFGWWLVFKGIHQNFDAGWEVTYSMFFGWIWNYAGSLFVVIGYVALFALLSRFMKMRFLANVGELACSNILFTSFICSFLFYGNGLALIGSISQVGQVYIICALWIVLLLLSGFWSRYYYFGPIEWLWRYLAYGQKPQFKK